GAGGGERTARGSSLGGKSAPVAFRREGECCRPKARCGRTADLQRGAAMPARSVRRASFALRARDMATRGGRGHTPKVGERRAIVLEGGAMRGVFSAGVLDAFAQRKLEPFDLAIGVSAGACNLASHLAEQRGRNRRCYFDIMTRPEFIDAWRFFRSG